MTTDIFNAEGDPSTTSASTDLTGIPPKTDKTDAGTNGSETKLPAELQEYIGPGKKYASLEAALASIPHAQTHIANLEMETKQLKDELKVSKETLLSSVETASRKTQETPVVDPNSVAEIVISTLDARSREAAMRANINAAQTALIEAVGSEESAADLVLKKARDLGMSVAMLRNIAATSPKAFLAYFSDVQKVNIQGDKFTPPQSSSISTSAIDTTKRGPEKDTYAWYQAMRKEKGDAWYFSPAITRERAATAVRVGRDKFFGKS